MLTSGITVGASTVLSLAGAIPKTWLVWPLAIAALGLFLALSIRFIPAVGRRSRALVYVLFYAVILMSAGFCVAGDFSPALAISYLFVITLLSVGGSVSSRRAWAMGTCLGIAILGGLCALFFSPEAAVPRLEFGALLAAHGGIHLALTIVRIRERARLVSERELFHDIVTRTTDGVAVAHALTGRILDANPTFERLAGGTEGRTAQDLLGDTAAAPLAPEAFDGNRELTHASGHVISIDLSAARVRFHDQEAVALVLHDASDRAEMERDLRAARDQAVQARYLAEEAREHAIDMLQMKSAFLANMSHELHTPLATIVGYADVLRDEAPEAFMYPVEEIRTAADRLGHTLSALLELAELEAGRLPVEHRPVDVSELAQKVVQEHREEAETRGLPLLFAAPQPAWALTDRAALTRVLGYLLDNALKFTPAGQVAVVAAASGGAVEVAIRDTGIGMDDAEVSRALDPFRQLSLGDDRTHEGSGLGLSLAYQLAGEMGATLQIESEKGQGTLVRVRLPASPLPHTRRQEDVADKSREYVVSPLYEAAM